MTFDERFHILKRYIKEELNVHELWSEYWILRATVRKIVDKFAFDQICWNNTDIKTKRNLKATGKIIKEVYEFYCNTIQLFVTNDVKTAIQNKYKVNLPSHIIRDTMKELLNLIKKKGKPTPFTISASKIDIIKSLFTVRIYRSINDLKKLININKTLFSRSTKNIHSWSAKGKEWTLNNIWCSNSFTFITTTLSIGTILDHALPQLWMEQILSDFWKNWRSLLRKTQSKYKRMTNYHVQRSNSSLKNSFRFHTWRRILCCFHSSILSGASPDRKVFCITKKNRFKAS